MTKDEQEVASANAPQIQAHKAADFKTFYVNWVQASFTPFDISLVIGEAFAADTPDTFEVEQKARIIFHPLEAKVVAGMLAQAIRNYEKQVGEVPVPRGLGATALEQEPIKEA
jgi:hypothetical protein